MREGGRKGGKNRAREERMEEGSEILYRPSHMVSLVFPKSSSNPERIVSIWCLIGSAMEPRGGGGGGEEVEVVLSLCCWEAKPCSYRCIQPHRLCPVSMADQLLRI